MYSACSWYIIGTFPSSMIAVFCSTFCPFCGHATVFVLPLRMTRRQCMASMFKGVLVGLSSFLIWPWQCSWNERDCDTAHRFCWFNKHLFGTFDFWKCEETCQDKSGIQEHHPFSTVLMYSQLAAVETRSLAELPAREVQALAPQHKRGAATLAVKMKMGTPFE